MVKGDYTVYLTVIDSHVFDFDQNVVDIIYGLQNYDRVILDMKKESPDLSCLGIEDTLQKIISTYNVPYGKMILRTANLIEQTKLIPVEHYDNIFSTKVSKTQSLNFEVDEITALTELTAPAEIVPLEKNIEKHFGIYIGRSNYTRLAMASYLDCFYSDITDITFHTDFVSDFHRSHIGLDKLLHYFGARHPISRSATKFVHKLPLTKDLIERYPINFADAWSGLSDSYSKIFLDVACESMISGNTFGSWSEKTKRCVVLKTPFLSVAPRNFLTNIKKLGYKTFDKWWDESYDYSEGPQRIIEITKIVDNLAKKPLSEIKAMYDDMQDVLIYNRDLAIDRLKNHQRVDQNELKKQFSICR